MRTLRQLHQDEQGLGALEFALIAPALLGFIIGIAQLGTLFFANADLNNALAAGARVAVVFPKPSDTTIRNQIIASATDLEQTRLTTPVITHGTDANGREYADISASYSVPLNFIFFTTPPVTLNANRRVFMQSDAVTPTTGTGTTSTSTTSATSSGVTSTTSASSASTSSTSTTSSSTTTSSNGGGNSNGNSDHAHGDCHGRNC